MLGSLFWLSSCIAHCYCWNPPFFQEHLKILYYTPDDVVENRKVRNIGLCEALVNFAKVFSLDKPCDYVHTQKAKQVFLEPEPGIWMVLVSDRLMTCTLLYWIHDVHASFFRYIYMCSCYTCTVHMFACWYNDALHEVVFYN